MGTHVNARVQKHRNSLRAAGLRPVQLWVFDTRQPGFQEEIDRQMRLVAKSDAKDDQLWQILDEAANDMANNGEWEPLDDGEK
jgi:hypothetical protein